MTSDTEGVTKVWRLHQHRNISRNNFGLQAKKEKSIFHADLNLTCCPLYIHSCITGNSSSGVIHEVTLLDTVLATEGEESHHDLRAS